MYNTYQWGENMDKANLRIVFMGTPSISAYVLEELIKNGYNIIGVIAQEDKPVGRKKIIIPVPTKEVALKYNIPIFQPVKIRKDYQFLIDINPDIIITLAYGQIVPQAVLDIPRLGCLNLHGSLLPKYRGAAPIQYALINNDKVTGMTLMEMTKEMDAGRMFGKKELIIEEEDNSTSLFKKMGVVAKDLILELLPLYVDGKLKGIPQDESLVSFAPSIKVEEEKLNLDDSINKILGYIRALSDEPGGYLNSIDGKLKIYKAKKYSLDTNHEIGEIISMDKKGFLLQVKGGVISLLEVQKEGKKRMDASSFINGNKHLLGSRLS